MSLIPKLSTRSPGDDLRLEAAIRLRSERVRSDFSWKSVAIFGDNNTVAVAMSSARKGCFSPRNFLAISSAIRNIACGCDSGVHLKVPSPSFPSSREDFSHPLSLSTPTSLHPTKSHSLLAPPLVSMRGAGRGWSTWAARTGRGGV